MLPTTLLPTPVASKVPLRKHGREAARVTCAQMTTSPTLANAKHGTSLEAARKAVRLASKLCQKVQLQLGAEERQDKPDDSPVTVADYGAQALVAFSLVQSFGATEPISIVAEEDSTDLRAESGKVMLKRITHLINEVLETEQPEAKLTQDDVLRLIDLGTSHGGPHGRHWVLDPIDGTRGFVGMRQYAVCLGLVQDGEVVLGVLGCPNLPQDGITDADGASGAAGRGGDEGVGSLFWAHKGLGAYASPLWDSTIPATRITVNDTRDFAVARFMESFESRHSDRNFTAAVAGAVGIRVPPLRMDSQVKYGVLSRGDASVFMRFPPASYKEKIWDHAAGVCIVEEAGGKVTDASGTRLDFSKGRYLPLDRGIIAAPPALHAALLAAINQIPPATN